MRLYQPIARRDFKPGTADLAGCEDCESTWLLDADDCGSIDTDVIGCPMCQGTNTGPVYACPE